MVLIKLSTNHKIAGIIITAMPLVAICLALAIGVILNNACSANNEPTSKTETSVDQFYESDTPNECDKTIGNIAFSNTSASIIEEVIKDTEITEENLTTVEETTKDVDKELIEEDLYTQNYNEQDAIDIAKVLYHECRGVPSKTEQACVAWTILNRVDYFDSTVYSVVRAPNQFAFYESAPVWDELLDLAHDVLSRWSYEKNGEVNVGRVLPKEYIYFEGCNGHNYFRDNYSGSYNIWDYSLESPYES